MTWEHRTGGGALVPPTRNWSDNGGGRIIGPKGTLDMTMLHYTFTPKGDGEGETCHEFSLDGDPRSRGLQQWDQRAGASGRKTPSGELHGGARQSHSTDCGHRGRAHIQCALSARQPSLGTQSPRQLRSRLPAPFPATQPPRRCSRATTAAATHPRTQLRCDAGGSSRGGFGRQIGFALRGTTGEVAAGLRAAPIDGAGELFAGRGIIDLEGSTVAVDHAHERVIVFPLDALIGPRAEPGVVIPGYGNIVGCRRETACATSQTSWRVDGDTGRVCWRRWG